VAMRGEQWSVEAGGADGLACLPSFDSSAVDIEAAVRGLLVPLCRRGRVTSMAQVVDAQHGGGRFGRKHMDLVIPLPEGGTRCGEAFKLGVRWR
jgi:hypothetical protein